MQVLDGTAHDGHIQTHAASGRQGGVPLPGQRGPEGGAPAVAEPPSSCPGDAAAQDHRVKTRPPPPPSSAQLLPERPTTNKEPSSKAAY